MNFNVCVVIPAGGIGERTTLNIPKQFYPVLGKPLICYTIEEFTRIPWIQKIVVVVASGCLSKMKTIILENGYRNVVPVVGGSTRHRSIASGINYLENHEPDVVVIHDAVRPNVPVSILTETVIAARNHGAAGIICPLISTVISKDDDNFLEESLDRSKYFASEMPQAFQFHVIYSAYKKCTDYDFEYGTECLHLAHKYANVRAKLVTGTSDLWKVTYKKDIYALEHILKGKMIENCKKDTKIQVESRGNFEQQFLIQLQENLFKKIEQHNSCSGKLILHDIINLQNIQDMVKEILDSEIIIHIFTLHTEINIKECIALIRSLAQFTDKSVSKLYFIWKMSQDWSNESMEQLINICFSLLTGSASAFLGQLFTV